MIVMNKSMHWAAVFVCAGLIALPAPPALAMNGAASKDELRQLFQRYFERRDEQKLSTLVYWRNVHERERSGFFRSLRNDLNYRLKKVELVALDPNTSMEYTLEGITFRPALPPIGRMVARYEGQGNVKESS